MTRPALDEIEVTVIGPSYGESVLVHLGDGQWIVIDSVVRQGQTRPAAIEYLDSIGVDPQHAVKLVVVTHWHDDHIRGIAKTVQICGAATVCVPTTFTGPEFLSFLAAHADPLASSFGTGVDELTQVFEMMRTRAENRMGLADTRLLQIPKDAASHKCHTEIWSLSPSAFQVTESLGKMAKLIPGFGKTKRRAVSTSENDHSVALWISIGDECILLGGDLEETPDARAGWSAIVASTSRPQEKASLFKVPHHGSATGHNEKVWTDMLHAEPHAILTPWNRARKLPSPADLDRLEARTKNVHLTAPPAELSRVKHNHEVEKLLRDFGIRTFREPREVGIVRARKKLGAADWVIDRMAP
jgi:beta-lactamase superfamily II metal-dependent hydrolase